jgi:hypothetical protein
MLIFHTKSHHFLFITGNLIVTSIKQGAVAVTHYQISNELPDTH